MFKHCVALGNSLTEGVSDWGRGDTRIGFVYVLAATLRATMPTMELTNLGVGGARVADVLRHQLPLARNHTPDLVTVVVGANDVPSTAIDQFARDYRTLLHALGAEVGGTIIVGTVPNFAHLLPPQFASYRDAVIDRVHAFNRAIVEAAVAHNALVVDLQDRDEVQDPRNVSADGVHPNARGYRVMAQAFVDTLNHSFPDLKLPPVDPTH